MEYLFDITSSYKDGKREISLQSDLIFVLKSDNKEDECKNITTAEFKFGDDSACSKYFNDQNILINKLKTDCELSVKCKPSVGYGKTHSRYNPVGTLAFSYITDNQKTTSVFLDKIDYLNNERSLISVS